MHGLAVLAAQHVGVVRRRAGKVLDLVEIGADAVEELAAGGGEIGEFEPDEAMIEAEAAVGFAPEGEGQGGFGVEEEVGDPRHAVGPFGLAAAHPEALEDERPDEHGEARGQSHEGGKVAKQPGRCAAFVCHAEQSNPATDPADSGHAFPPLFSGKSLESWRKIFEFPPDLNSEFPPKATSPCRSASLRRSACWAVQRKRAARSSRPFV